MDKLQFGDIVLLKFPFTDAVTFKKRPALVLNDIGDGDLLVCRITSQLYETPFDLSVTDWKKCGLKLPSVIRIHKVATLEKEMVDEIIGKIGDKMKDQVRIRFTSLVD